MGGAGDVMATLMRRMALAVAVVLHLGLVGVARGQLDSRDDLRLELLLGRALKEGAVCLDGSPSGYWYRPGTGAGANNWIVFLEGGGWCYDEKACLYRSGTMLGSSTQWPATMPVDGRKEKGVTALADRPLFSADPSVNPDFYDWNIVYVGCSDGGLATIVHADQVSKYFGSGTVFKAVPFSGFFPDTDNFQGVQWFQGVQDYIFSMQ